MPRPPNIQRTIKKTICLREDVVARMELELFSEREGRVPQGAQAELINMLLEQYFQRVDAARVLAVSGSAA